MNNLSYEVHCYSCTKISKISSIRTKVQSYEFSTFPDAYNFSKSIPKRLNGISKLECVISEKFNIDKPIETVNTTETISESDLSESSSKKEKPKKSRKKLNVINSGTCTI